jgi:hypothetical protein
LHYKQTLDYPQKLLGTKALAYFVTISVTNKEIITFSPDEDNLPEAVGEFRLESILQKLFHLHPLMVKSNIMRANDLAPLLS